MALFDPAIFDPDAFDAGEPTPPPDGSTDPYLSGNNPLFNGTLRVTVGSLDVTANLLPGLSYSNTNPGGFGEAIFRLPAQSPVWGYDVFHPEVVKGAAVTITHGSSPVTLFEGEITNDVSHATVEDGFAYYEVTAAGKWWKAGMRRDFCRIWADDDPGQWFELTSGGPFQVDTEGKLDIRLEAGQVAKNGASKSLYYWLDSGLGEPAAELQYVACLITANVSDKDSAQWHFDFSSSDSPWGTWTENYWVDSTTVSTDTPFFFALSNGAKAIRLRLYVDTATSTGTTADRYVTVRKMSILSDDTFLDSITNISVANPTELTVTGAAPKTGERVFIEPTSTTPSVGGWYEATNTGASTFTVPVNVTSGGSTGWFLVSAPRVDDAMCDVATATGLASSTSRQSGGIGYMNYGINIRPHMSRAEAIEYLAGTHSEPIDYGFWDSAEFYCQERPTTPPTTNDYIIDVSAPGIDFDVFKNVEGAPDVVKVLYKFRDVDGGSSVYPDGTLRAVYRPSAPTWSDASEVVEVWEDWADMVLTEDQAEAIGDQILAWYDANAYSGTITIAAPTVPLRAGGSKNTAYIRAGDYIQDAMTTIGRSMITGFEMDVDSGVATVAIGETRNDFVARIARYEGHQMDRGRSPNGQYRPRRRR